MLPLAALDPCKAGPRAVAAPPRSNFTATSANSCFAFAAAPSLGEAPAKGGRSLAALRMPHCVKSNTACVLNLLRQSASNPILLSNSPVNSCAASTSSCSSFAVPESLLPLPSVPAPQAVPHPLCIAMPSLHERLPNPAFLAPLRVPRARSGCEFSACCRAHPISRFAILAARGTYSRNCPEPGLAEIFSGGQMICLPMPPAFRKSNPQTAIKGQLRLGAARHFPPSPGILTQPISMDRTFKHNCFRGPPAKPQDDALFPLCICVPRASRGRFWHARLDTDSPATLMIRMASARPPQSGRHPAPIPPQKAISANKQ